MKISSFLCSAILWLAVGYVAQAAQPVAVLNAPEASANLRAVTAAECAIVPEFSTDGKWAIRFTSPRWLPEENAGKHCWPAMELIPEQQDWTGYNFLGIDVVNASDARQDFILYLTDDKTPFRKGAYLREKIEAREYKRIAMPVAEALRHKNIDPGKIRLLHIASEDPAADLTFYLSNFRLYNNESETPNPEFSAQYRKLREARLADWRKRIQKTKALLLARASDFDSPEYRGLLRRKLEFLDRMAKMVNGDFPEERLTLFNLDRELNSLGKLADWVRNMRKSPFRNSPVLLGVESPMRSILPLAPEVTEVPERVHLQLAAGEYESVQLFLMPLETALSKVNFEISELKSETGKAIPAGNITVSPLGYVKTEWEAPYRNDYIGWHPNFVLDFVDSAKVEPDVAQGFLVRLHAPAGQAAGIYTGTLRIRNGETELFRLPLEAKVFDFELPAAPFLDLAITFWGDDQPFDGERTIRAERIKDPEYPMNLWKKRKPEWAEFLSRYYITSDSLYDHRDWNPDFPVLQELKKRNRLSRFNLGYFPCASENSQDSFGMKATIERLRPRYETAKKLGLLEHAYFYGCDEVPSSQLPRIGRAGAILKETFPGVELITTAVDPNYGVNSPAASIDGWVVLLNKWEAEKVRRAREDGRKAWWYLSVSTESPYPNVFIEYPPADIRLLMGALAAKYRPDGFLYYQISIWNTPKPLNAETFTTWNPRSYEKTHGDGSMTGVGPDGIPVSTLRLENFRDGLDDLAYARILEQACADVRNRNDLTPDEQAAIAEAERQLKVPASVAASLTEFTRDAKTLNRYREALAKSIETMKKIKRNHR